MKLKMVKNLRYSPYLLGKCFYAMNESYWHWAADEIFFPNFALKNTIYINKIY